MCSYLSCPLLKAKLSEQQLFNTKTSILLTSC